MAFYKRQNEELLTAPNFVLTSEYELTIDNKDNFVYPIDGWYWFDTLDEAMKNMVFVSTDAVTMYQARIALYRAGLLPTVESAINRIGGEAAIIWTTATIVKRDSPLIDMVKSDVGLTDAQIDELFTIASRIV